MRGLVISSLTVLAVLLLCVAANADWPYFGIGLDGTRLGGPYGSLSECSAKMGYAYPTKPWHCLAEPY